MRLPIRSDLLLVLLFALFPVIPGLDEWANGVFRCSVGANLTWLFILTILCLALNVVVGYAGQLHLGIAAYFGVGAYVTGILLTTSYPFHLGSRESLPSSVGIMTSLFLAFLAAAILCAFTSAPMLRLRGDYLALVTLGFGEVARFALRNLEEITNGTIGITAIPHPNFAGIEPRLWGEKYQYFFYLNLLALFFVLILLRNLERSRIGRAWVALREDELAATCMGLDVAKLKLAAFTLGGGLAGFAGGLYALKLQGTADPDEYSFQKSIIVLACIILGGLANRTGVILGVMILLGFDKIIAPAADDYIQAWRRTNENLNLFGIIPIPKEFLSFSSWRLMVFGVALILIMRLRPEGLLPASRIRSELHSDETPADEQKPSAPAKEG